MEIKGQTIILEPGEEITIRAREKEEPKVLDLKGILSVMNPILSEYGFTQVSEKGTPETYGFVETVYSNALYEWSEEDCWLFSPELYKDVYDWHGKDRTYYTQAHDSIIAWAVASCLAELCPTIGEKTNCQTEIFRKAYELGGGRAVPLFGLDIHSDPMIARSAGSAVYALTKYSYSRTYMDKMRKELGSKLIPALKWSDLGYQGEENVMNGMRYLGYLVNSDIIIPSAPGPYADGCMNRTKPFEQGQPRDQFYDYGQVIEWRDYNYKCDAWADDHMVSNYNMGAQTPLSTWNGYSEETKQRILEAVAAPRATDNFFFGKKLIKFDGLHDGTRAGLYTNYCYYWFSEVYSKGKDVYEVGGPFADLHDLMFTGGGFGTPTDALRFFHDTMNIADNSRYPTFENQYGRRRPCGGSSGTGGSARSSVNGDPLNALYNIDISCIFADDQKSRDKWAKENGFVSEKPKSYPSGHTTMTWYAALMLGQMAGDERVLEEYMTKAYQVGVNRTVSRYHWTTDVIYGRLIATMVLPIINAMSGLLDSYEKTKNIINGETDPYAGDVYTTITITNNSGKTVRHDGKVCFITYGADPRGGYTGYFRVKGTCYGGDFTINSGESKTYDVVFRDDDSQTPKVALNMPFASSGQRGKYQSNNCYYIGGNGMTCRDFPASETFRQYGVYTMVIPSDTHEWTT